MKRLLLSISILLLLSSCAGDEVRPPSEDSELALEAFGLSEAMRSAYVNKDFNDLAGLSTESGYKEIAQGIGGFDSAELTFTPRLVDIEDSKVSLNISWQGRWTVGGKIREARGMAVFELVGKPLKLNRILRGSPFKVPE